MIEKSKNKMQQRESTKELEVYHFSGNGEYEPMNIEAASPQEAADKWVEQRKPVYRQATE